MKYGILLTSPIMINKKKRYPADKNVQKVRSISILWSNWR